MQKITIFLLLLFVSTSINAQVGIGTNSPTASAALDVTSSSKGFLPPRVALTSSTDVSTIASPATGLLVYCTGASGLTAGYYYYNGTAWVNIAGNGFVPYTGATSAVNLGAYDLTVNGVKVGRGAGQVSSNIALGGSAINGNSTSTNLIGIGNNTMTYTGGVGNNNIAIGNNSVFGGSSSIGIGYNTLANNGYRANSPQTDVGNRNIAIGDASLSTSGTINDNVSIGASAMGNASQYLRFNVAIGTQALYNMQGYHSDYISGGNIAIGYKSSFTTVGGTENTFVGHLSGYNNNSGSGNTSLGTSSLNTNTSGSNNTAIGKNADVATSGLSNATALGYGASVSASNTIQLGNSSVTSVITSGTISADGYTTTSDSRLKTNIEAIDNGLSTVLQLQPYHYEKKSGISASTHETKEFGFLAQDIQTILPELVKEGSDADKTLSVNYVAIIPILTSAIKEQQQMIEQLKAQIIDVNKKMKHRKRKNIALSCN